MAVPTNTLLTFSAVGNREDLLDKITNISPTDVPFTTMIGTSTSAAVLSRVADRRPRRRRWQRPARRRRRDVRGGNADRACRQPYADQPQGNDRFGHAGGRRQGGSQQRVRLPDEQAPRRDQARPRVRSVVEPGPGNGQLVHRASAPPALRLDHDQRRSRYGWCQRHDLGAATDGTQRALTLAMVTTGPAERMDAGRQARLPALRPEAARRADDGHGWCCDQVLRGRRQEDDGHDPGIRRRLRPGQDRDRPLRARRPDGRGSGDFPARSGPVGDRVPDRPQDGHQGPRPPATTRRA
jgi:hypothetical protein